MNTYIALHNNLFGAGLPPAAIAVYTYLGAMENRKSGVCFPSVATIAAACGMGVTSVRKALRKLTAAGLLTVCAATAPTKSGRMRQTANLYTLTPPAETTATPTLTHTATPVAAPVADKGAGSQPVEKSSPDRAGAIFRASPRDAHPLRNLTGEINKTQEKNNTFVFNPLSPPTRGEAALHTAKPCFIGQRPASCGEAALHFPLSPPRGEGEAALRPMQTQKEREKEQEDQEAEYPISLNDAGFKWLLQHCYFHPDRAGCYRDTAHKKLAMAAMKRLWHSRGVWAKGEFISREEVRRLLFDECSPDILDYALDRLDKAHFVRSPTAFLAATLLDSVRHADSIFDAMVKRDMWGYEKKSPAEEKLCGGTPYDLMDIAEKWYGGEA